MSGCASAPVIDPFTPRSAHARKAADVQSLKAANDNMVSETAALRTQLKAANDNYAELRKRSKPSSAQPVGGGEGRVGHWGAGRLVKGEAIAPSGHRGESRATALSARSGRWDRRRRDGDVYAGAAAPLGAETRLAGFDGCTAGQSGLGLNIVMLRCCGHEGSA
jgi:outer membrane murein-binding lipoprotein Lpp